MGPLGRAYSRFVLAVVVYFSTTRLIDPKVYAAVGLDVDEAVAAAAANPRWRQTKQFAARKVIENDAASSPNVRHERTAGVRPCRPGRRRGPGGRSGSGC